MVGGFGCHGFNGQICGFQKACFAQNWINNEESLVGFQVFRVNSPSHAFKVI